MARKKIIAGNWKMNMTPSEAVKLVETLKPLVKNDEVDVVFCVPAIDIVPVVEAAKGTNIQVGAENMYFEEKGAYTGEISPNMLVDAGVKIGFQGLTADQAKKAVIAYEPIWAIGTGKTATTEQAQEVCGKIRECIAEVYDDATAAEIRIQYGGSVNSKTAADLFAQADIDGGLVGGASLKEEFGQIVNYK